MRVIILVCGLMQLVGFSVVAVELSDAQYRQVIQDMTNLYREQKTSDLQILKHSSDIQTIHLQTDNKRHGQLWIKLPIKLDDITVLQIPHKLFDKDTDVIGQDWFEANHVDVLMENTEHRHATNSSDLSRLRYSLFTAFVEGLISLNIKARIVQLHGYDATKRKTASGKHADFILSNGTNSPEQYLLAIQSCSRDNAGLLARLYGRDIFELGATQNPIGKLIRTNKNEQVRFLHIEMPRQIRRGFVNKSITEEAIACLLKQ